MKSKRPQHFCNKCGSRVNAAETRIHSEKYMKLPWYWCNNCCLLLDLMDVHVPTKLGHIEGVKTFQTQVISE